MPTTIGIYFTGTHDGTRSMYRVPNDVKGVVKLVVEGKPLHLAMNHVVITFTGYLKFELYRFYFFWSENYRRAVRITNQVIVIPAGAFLAEDRHLPVGEYEFPFRFKTITDGQSNIPTSVKDSLGKIEYKVEVKFHLSSSRWRDCFIKAESCVTLVNPVEISSLMEHYLERKDGEKEITVGCGLGYVKLSAEIPRGAYRSGEAIQVAVFISNNSQRYITPKIDLVKTRKLRILQGKDVKTVSICSDKIKKAVKPKTLHWSKLMVLYLPNVFHPGSVLGDNRLEITYAVEVSVVIPGEPRTAKVKLPIVIGR